MVKILMVEDEPAMRELMEDLAKAQGVATVSAGNGKEALEILNKDPHSFTAVFTDLNMPVMGGIEFLAKAHDQGHDLPIVVVSGHLDQALTIEALKLGAFDFLPKPFPVDKFESMVVDVSACAEELRKAYLEVDEKFAKSSQPGDQTKIQEMKNYRKAMVQMKFSKKSKAS
jgi:DNA-binding NtrC family response regulator